MILITLAVVLRLLGPAKDHKHNWAMRHVIYQLLRCKMEVMASTPLAGYDFLKNIMKLMNSPAACLSTLQKWFDLLKFADIWETVETGKYAG